MTDGEKLPDLIHGDLDSLRQDTRDFYEAHGVRVSHDGDQYSTDFGKAMKILTAGYKDGGLSILGPKNPASLKQSQEIIILSTLSGRVDQGLGLIHELYRETRSHSPESTSPARLWFVSEQSMSFVLPVGKSTIQGIYPAKGTFTKSAGIIPVYGPAKITTKGFEWDVQDWDTRMGEMVSTSNHVLGDVVEIDVVGEAVLFTIETAGKD